MECTKKIGILDLKDIKDTPDFATNPAWLAAAEAVREGLGAVGFLYVINHGISEELIRDVHSETKKLFELPLDVKMQYTKESDTKLENGTMEYDPDKYGGYMPIGEEKLDESTKNRAYEVKEVFDWLDKGRSRIPRDEVPDLEPTLNTLNEECKKFLNRFFRLMAMALKLDDLDTFLNAFSNFHDPEKLGTHILRLLRYPELDDAMEAPPGTVRCGEHSDYLFVTMLFQDDVGGLEVKTLDGNWIHAKPIPGSILINTADLTEFWTCGIFPATRHRITIPDVSDERRRQSRYSVVFFCGPNRDAVITPVDMEKRSYEQERLEQSGKVYSKKPVVALDHLGRRVNVARKETPIIALLSNGA